MARERREEAREQTLLAVAERMLGEGMSVSTIARLTGLSGEVVTQVAKGVSAEQENL